MNPIEKLEFSVRTYNILKQNGVNYENDLRNLSYDQITKFKNISRLSLEEIERKLGKEFK